MRYFFSVFFFLFLIHSLLGQQIEKTEVISGVEIIHAAEAEFILGQQNEDGTFFFQGGVIARSGEIIIRAEKVKINNQTGEIFAQGNVSLEKDEQKLNGEKLLYNRKTGMGVLYDSEGNFQQMYAASQKTFLANEGSHFLLEDLLWTADLELNPEFYFKAKKIWFYENNQVAALGITFYVGGVPVFYLPILLQTDLGTGILLAYGYNKSRGHYFQSTYNFSLFPAIPSKNFFSQIAGKVWFDFYQYDGSVFGALFQKRSPKINYTLDFALADSKKKDIVNSQRYTNLILQKDGSYKEEHNFWWKVKMDFNSTLVENIAKDQDLTLTFSFEHYRHKLFLRKFGSRTEPKNTLQMFEFARPFTNYSPIEKLLWKLAINKTWKNSRLSFDMSRSLAWYEKTTEQELGYRPQLDILPRLQFDGSYLVKKQGKKIDGPIITQVFAEMKILQHFSEGKFDHNVFSYHAFNRWFYYLNFLPWLKFVPSAGLGSQMFLSTSANKDIQKDLDKESFQYVFINSSLDIGISEILFQWQHKLQYSFADFALHDLFGHMRSHFTKFSLSSDVGNFFHFKTFISRDLRAYPFRVSEASRWSPWQTDVFFAVNFVEGFNTNFNQLVKHKREHFVELILSNSFVYNTFYRKPERNESTLSFRLGGYNSPIIKKLINLQFGISYFHNFLTLPSSFLTFQWEVDLLLHRFWRFKAGSRSVAKRFEVYQKGHSQYIPFWQDTANSLNIFNSKSLQKGNFNLENIFVTLEHDLHHWVWQISYIANAQIDYLGTTMKKKVLFYEHGIYFSFRLKQFDWIGMPPSQVYQSKTK